jgi:deazaflavin-dependent oxidoreductase (nitroreductase family)
MTIEIMARSSGICRWLLRAPAHLYHFGCGPLLGHRFLLLGHIGRRTGLRRETVLEVMEYRQAGPELVVISAFGPKSHWLQNIEAAPSVEIFIGREHLVASYRILAPEESEQVVRGYEERNWYLAPLIRMVLSQLLGWRYSGSQSDRRKLVNQLPLIAFKPGPDLQTQAHRLTIGKKLGPGDIASGRPPDLFDHLVSSGEQ